MPSMVAGQAPLAELQQTSSALNAELGSIELATQMDKEDGLSALRGEFCIPPHGDGDSIYFVGNSLGLQPKALPRLLAEELEVWSKRGVEGHFNHDYKRPWLTVDEECADLLCGIVGAQDGEVAAMGTLTTNLHLLMCAFYRPTLQRYKVVLENKAFPSDHVRRRRADSRACCSIW